MEQGSTDWYKNMIVPRLPIFSFVSAVVALISCCNPPAQLLFGVAAVMLAVLSRQGAPMKAMARIALIVGIVCIIGSVLIFLQYMMAMHVMGDPANAELVQEVLRQYREVFEEMGVPQS